VTRLLTALAAAVLIAIAGPAGAGAHRTRTAHAQSFHKRHAVHTQRGRHRHAAHHGRTRGGRHPRGAHKRRHRHAAVKHTVRHGSHARHADTNGCEGTNLRPDAENLEAVREATLCLVNRERVTRGERALTLNDKLERTAQEHSESMAQDDYFGHEGPDGSTPLSRMRAAGYIYSSRVGYEIGENIAWGTLWLATPRAIVESWMQSPGHRENILDPSYRDTGIGVSPHALASQAGDQAGGIYTQDFGVIITG
jgi:uncharacterized protein YkwD